MVVHVRAAFGVYCRGKCAVRGGESCERGGTHDGRKVPGGRRRDDSRVKRRPRTVARRLGLSQPRLRRVDETEARRAWHRSSRSRTSSEEASPRNGSSSNWCELGVLAR
eukprot:2721775-Pleurochrysis_carterae.AAC.1